MKDTYQFKHQSVEDYDQDLIEYIKTKKTFNDKVTIIHQDIWVYLQLETPQKFFDVIWLDIWEDVCPDNLVDMYPMIHLARRFLRRDGKVLIWCIKTCEYMTKSQLGSLPSKNEVIRAELKKRGIA